MRLFQKTPFLRSSRYLRRGGEPVEDSIGSDISTKDQFDILVPIKHKQLARYDAAAAANNSAARSWGAGLMGVGALLDKSGSNGAGGGGATGDDDTTVSSITTSPEWQQPHQGSRHPPYGNGSSRGASSDPDDGKSSWACCGCAPMSSVAGENDGEEDGATGEGDGKNGMQSPTTENTLAPTTHYEPMACRRTAAENSSLLSSHAENAPSIVNHEGIASAPVPIIRNSRAIGSNINEVEAPPPPPTSAPPSSSPWCCAGGRLCPVTPSASRESSSPNRPDALAADRNLRRSSYSLFDGLDDDDRHYRRGGSNRRDGSGGGGGRKMLKRKIQHSIRRAMGVPPLWGSQLRSRTRSFRRSSQNHAEGNDNYNHDDRDLVPSSGPEPLAILATTHQDDRYYWHGSHPEACATAE